MIDRFKERRAAMGISELIREVSNCEAQWPPRLGRAAGAWYEAANLAIDNGRLDQAVEFLKKGRNASDGAWSFYQTVRGKYTASDITARLKLEMPEFSESDHTERRDKIEKSFSVPARLKRR